MSLDLFNYVEETYAALAQTSTVITRFQKLTLSIVNKFPLRSLNRFFLFPPFETFQPVEGYFLLPQAARKDIKTNYV